MERQLLPIQYEHKATQNDDVIDPQRSARAGSWQASSEIPDSNPRPRIVVRMADT
jgi:hypothetical protein